MKFEVPPRTVEELEREVLERELRIKELEAKLREVLERELRIKELELKLKKAEKDALTDPLTDLYNRRGLEKTARLIMPEGGGVKDGHEQRGVEQRTKNAALLHLDIDGFKEINDRYGHSEGDRIIREAAEFLTKSMRPNDVVARMGGDEFVVILNGATERIIHKFFDQEADPPRPRFGFVTEIDGEQKRISFSGGITLMQPDETGDDLDHMIGRADDALYESKKSGRDRISLFTERNTPKER